MNQTKLSSFYTKKSRQVMKSMDDAKNKKLSLISKSPEFKNNNNKMLKNVIDLCSDSDDEIFTVKKEKTCDLKIVYSPSTPKKKLTSPSSKQHSKSPRSKTTFYSPTKSRRILSPTKRNRNLNKCLFSSNDETSLESSFIDYCTGHDDKTIFLLKIIHKFLNEDSLRVLLPEGAHRFLTECLRVIKPGMGLVCRLYWRKQRWFRRHGLSQVLEKECVMDDDHLDGIIQSLAEIGCLESSDHGDTRQSKMDIDDYFDILKLEEIKEICKELKLKGQNKTELIKSIKNYSSRQMNITNYFMGPKCNNANTVTKRLKMKTGCCYRLSEKAHLLFTKLYYLMYLGINYNIIREKKLELLLLNDKAKKETYPIGDDTPLDNASVVFSNWNEFESYFNVCLVRQQWEATQNLQEKLDLLKNVYNMYQNIGQDDMLRYKSLPPWLRRFTPAYIHLRIMEEGVTELKKCKDEGSSKLAVKLLSELISQKAFRQHKRHDWYLEKALVLHNYMKEHEAAAEVLLEAFKSDMPEEMKQALQPRAMNLATMKSNKIGKLLRMQLTKHANGYAIREMDFDAYHIQQKPMERFNNKGKIKFEMFSELGERIVLEAEQFCIRHYISRGKYTHGEHWEGRIVTTIFFLLFWDIIYMRLPGVRGIFMTKFFMYPQDLFTDSFYLNRKSLIDERLTEIENSSEEELLSMMKETWDSRPEYERSGIERAVGWGPVGAVARCLSGAGAGALCRRLALDFSYAHSGFPDLTLWNPDTKKIMFVEVKTDSDSPSVKQLQWLKYLETSGLKAQLCYVGVDTFSNRARGPHCDYDMYDDEL